MLRPGSAAVQRRRQAERQAPEQGPGCAICCWRGYNANNLSTSTSTACNDNIFYPEPGEPQVPAKLVRQSRSEAAEHMLGKRDLRAALTAAVRLCAVSRAGGSQACKCMHWHRSDLGQPRLLGAPPRQCLHDSLLDHAPNPHPRDPSQTHGHQCPCARLSSGSCVSACAAARTSTLRSAACCGLRAVSCRTRSWTPKPALVAPTCTARIYSLSGRPTRLPPAQGAVHQCAETPRAGAEAGSTGRVPHRGAIEQVGSRWRATGAAETAHGAEAIIAAGRAVLLRASAGAQLHSMGSGAGPAGNPAGINLSRQRLSKHKRLAALVLHSQPPACVRPTRHCTRWRGSRQVALRRMQRTALPSYRPVGALQAGSLQLARTAAQASARRALVWPALRSRCTPVAYVRGHRQTGPDQRTAASQPGAALLADAVGPGGLAAKSAAITKRPYAAYAVDPAVLWQAGSVLTSSGSAGCAAASVFQWPCDLIRCLARSFRKLRVGAHGRRAAGRGESRCCSCGCSRPAAWPPRDFAG